MPKTKPKTRKRPANVVDSISDIGKGRIVKKKSKRKPQTQRSDFVKG